MSVLTDRTKELMEDFKSLDLGSEDLPPEIQAQDEDPSEENQKKAGHAFKKMRDVLRLARSVVEEQQAESGKREEKPSPPQQQAQSGVNLEQQKQLYLSNLQTRAMQATGITDVADPILQLEIHRQYSADREMAGRQATAAKDAEVAFESVAAEFSQFDDEDKASVQEALATVPELDRTPDKIREKFNAYRGANFEKFASSSKSGVNGRKPDAGASAAAISSVKRGVQPGEGSPQADADDSSAKAATPEERKGMRSVGADPDNLTMVQTFRRAQKKKSRYVEK